MPPARMQLEGQGMGGASGGADGCSPPRQASSARRKGSAAFQLVLRTLNPRRLMRFSYIEAR